MDLIKITHLLFMICHTYYNTIDGNRKSFRKQCYEIYVERLYANHLWTGLVRLNLEQYSWISSSTTTSHNLSSWQTRLFVMQRSILHKTLDSSKVRHLLSYRIFQSRSSCLVRTTSSTTRWCNHLFQPTFHASALGDRRIIDQIQHLGGTWNRNVEKIEPNGET